MLLVFTRSGDSHAEAVAWGLRCINHDVCLIEQDRFPKDLTISVDPRSWDGLINGPNSSVRLSSARVLWNRRAGRPQLPTGIDPQDHEYSVKLSQTFLDSLRCLEGANRVWVNPRSAQVRADSKLEQLRVADSSGIRVPRTLVSNDVSSIKNFLSFNAEAIMKPLVGHGWISSKSRVASATVPAPNPEHFPTSAFQACPMMFQERIEKSYELRVVFYGDYLLPVRITTQNSPDTSLDWRFGNLSGLSPEVIPLPQRLAAQLTAFRRAFSLLHGSFDLAIDKDGEAVFFEVNEQGQTLWLEELNPDIPALDVLTEFLIAPADDFVWSGHRRFSMQHFYKSNPGIVLT